MWGLFWGLIVAYSFLVNWWIKQEKEEINETILSLKGQFYKLEKIVEELVRESEYRKAHESWKITNEKWGKWREERNNNFSEKSNSEQE
jgi:hypothetical protein